MLKQILIPCLLFTVLSCFSQECKIAKDPITSEKVISFYARKRLSHIKFEHKNAITRLETVIFCIGINEMALPKGSEIIFKLENNEIVSLKTASDVQPISSANSSDIFTSYTCTYELSEEVLKKLAAAPVVFVRAPDTRGGTTDYTLKNNDKKFYKNLQQGAQCILTGIDQPIGK